MTKIKSNGAGSKGGGAGSTGTETKKSLPFHKHLRTLRENRGWSQESLALKVGVSSEYISMLETGIRVPSYATQEAVAKAFGMKIGKLMMDVG